jgi:hypothetical protein
MKLNAAKNKGACPEGSDTVPGAPRKLPVSGSEPTFTYRPYGTPSGITSANCYAYAVQHALKNNFKLQPGNLSKRPGDFDLATCHPAKQRVIDDFVERGTGYETTACGTCGPGYSKICLLLSKDNDFHFLRQNGDVIYRMGATETREGVAKKFRVPRANVVPYPRTGSVAPGKCVRVIAANVWSHKRGLAFGPELVDARGNIIVDPRYADFDYGDLNYDRICSFFCVRQKKTCTVRDRK